MSDALVQALMMGQRRRADPLERRRAYGEEILKQGSSTAPVYSPLEGLARALQGGVGGYFAGSAEREQKEKSAKGIEALTAAINAKDPTARAAALKGLDPDNEYTAPMLGQMLTQQVADERAQARLAQGAGQLGAGYGMPPQGGAPASAPQGGGGVNPNNIGNVRPVGGGPNSGFQQPPTLEDGVRLAVNNVRAYPAKFNNGQPMTLMQIGQRWAPVGDGANNPAQWAANVASIGGLDPNVPIDLNDPMTAAKFARGVHGAEHGANKALPVERYAQVLQGGSQPATGAPTPLTINMTPGGQPPVPQGSADANGTPKQPPPAQQPPIPDVPRPQPTPQQLARHQQILQQGGYGQGPEAVAKARAAIEEELNRDWTVQRDRARMQFEQQSGDYKDTRNRTAEQLEFDRRQAIQNQEHDRREQTKPPDATQSLSAGFADRMRNSAPIINQFALEGTSKGARVLDSKVFGVGVPFSNSMQTEGFQRFRQARDDFINAQLRRESGAVISDQEYESADRQYFPQPGDAPSVLKQKELNRRLAVEGMIRNAGPSYKPSASVPPEGAQPPAANAAPQPGAVVDGYRFKGGNPADQNSWERVQ